MNQKELITDLFDRTASSYGTVGTNFFDHFGRRLVEFGQVNEGESVLDIACGKGAVLFPAAQAVRRSGQVIGIDLSHGMLDCADGDMRKNGFTNINLVHGDAERLIFADGGFDKVLCGFGIFFCPDSDRALAEAFRVLKTGGTIAISTWAKSEERRKWIGAALLGTLGELNPAEYTRLMPSGFDTAEDLSERLDRAGFSDMETVAEEFAFFYRDEEEWWEAQWSHGVRSILEFIKHKAGQEGLDRFKLKAFEYLQTIKRPQGIPHKMTALLTRAMKF